MKTKDRITQVTLTRRYNTNSLAMEVCWIPSHLAKKGKMVRDEGGWIWTVTEVWGTKEVEDLEKQHAAWREFASKLDGH